MTDNTGGTTPSSPSPQEIKDAMDKRTATVRKATSRTTEIVGYLGMIEKAITSTLPEFVALHPMGQAIDDFAALEDASEALEKAATAIKSRIAYAREVSFPARMDAEESKTFTAESGNRITRTARVYASMNNEAGVVPDGGVIAKGPLKGEYPDLVGCSLGFVWLRLNDLGPLIKPTVNSSALSAAAKSLMEEGRELPEELFRTHTKDGVSITRKKK